MLDRRQVLLGAAGGAMVLATPAAAAVADKVAGLLKRHKVPGASLAAIESGKIVWTAAFGDRWDGGGAVTEDMRFQAASVSKTINALAVLGLVRDGRLDLDTPVNEILSSWKLGGPNADEVTASHLLSHTGATNVHGFAGYYTEDPEPSLDQILDGLPPANSAAVVNTGRPGRKHVYSGGGITVLQKLVEDVTGESYSTVVDRLVLVPLGMSASLMRRAVAADTTTVAAGHAADGSYIGYNDYPELAAAGLWTTPTDLCRAVIAIMASHEGDAGALLPKDLARRMLTPVKDGAALGTFINGNRFSHNGVNWGYRATYVGNLSSRSGYAIMSNGENGEALNTDLVAVIAEERGW